VNQSAEAGLAEALADRARAWRVGSGCGALAPQPLPGPYPTRGLRPLISFIAGKGVTVGSAIPTQGDRILSAVGIDIGGGTSCSPGASAAGRRHPAAAAAHPAQRRRLALWLPGRGRAAGRARRQR